MTVQNFKKWAKNEGIYEKVKECAKKDADNLGYDVDEYIERSWDLGQRDFLASLFLWESDEIFWMEQNFKLNEHLGYSGFTKEFIEEA